MNTKILSVRQGKVINPVSELHAKDVRIAELQDALEFSERVAKRLVTDENLGVVEDCQPDMPYGWGRLKAARLAVEEEMDGTD